MLPRRWAAARGCGTAPSLRHSRPMPPTKVRHQPPVLRTSSWRRASAGPLCGAPMWMARLPAAATRANAACRKTCRGRKAQGRLKRLARAA
eukprot:365428-Chlamydomonas_euryale.AAC.22